MNKKTKPLAARTLVLTATAILSLSAAGWASEAVKGDPAKGEALHEKHCIACHAGRFDGDASKMYTRPNRKTANLAKLNSMVGYCSQQLGLQWFDEEVADVAAYLNGKYYQFK
ncbi:MAG: cytochrome c [Magnetococcales bacterium]|nr:cytochrome c [Magnetococcales bacterium]